MNVTIKYKTIDQNNLLKKFSNIKFVPQESISKKIKDNIESEHSRNLSRSNYHREKYYSDKIDKQVLSVNYSNIPQKQTTNKINKIKFGEADKSVNEFREIFNKTHFANKENNQSVQHKLSIQTAVSTTISTNNSAQKRRAHSYDNPQQVVLKQNLSQLKQKNAAYIIKWRNSASNVTKSMRVILGEWLMQVAKEINLPKNVVYNAMHYLDKYVGAVHVPRKKYQLVGLCSIFIASKLQISSHPQIDTFIEAMDSTCTKTDIIELEQAMVFKLKFRLNPPTLYQYMVLVISLFENFVKRKDHTEFKHINFHPKSQFCKDLFWVLDGVHLEDIYKSFHNKEKVCLSILYICLKKQKSKISTFFRKKVISDLQIFNFQGTMDCIFQQFLYEVIILFNKLSDLKQSIKVLRKWVKYDRSLTSDEEEGELLKKIILAQA